MTGRTIVLLAALSLVFLPLPVAAENADGDREPLTAVVSDRCEVRVQAGDPESGACWFLACVAEDAVELGCSIAAMNEVADLSVSPDRRWLAVISVGEGHPILEVIDLQVLASAHEYRALASVNPYPGTVNLAGWTAHSLRVSSEMPLSELPVADAAIEDFMSSSPQVYELDLDTWKIDAVRPTAGEDKPAH